MSLYKFRSVNVLLNGFRELEKSEIYFASYDELNDPFEGLEDIYWQGDEVLWKNLLRHFLLCLDSRFTNAQFSTICWCNMKKRVLALSNMTFRHLKELSLG